MHRTLQGKKMSLASLSYSGKGEKCEVSEEGDFGVGGKKKKKERAEQFTTVECEVG